MKNIYYILVIAILNVFLGCNSAENEVVLPANKFDYISFDVSKVNANEKDAKTISTSLIYSSTTPLKEDLKVSYTISYPEKNAAKEGVDFTLPANSGTVVIPAGKYTADVELMTVVDNDISVGKREVVFNLSPIENVTLGKPSDRNAKSVTVTINEDDLFEFGYTNFEEVPTFDKYERYSFSKKTEAYLANEQDKKASSKAPYVSYPKASKELGFVASYVAAKDTNKKAKEIMGVYNNTVAAANKNRFQTVFKYGNQGYVTSDLDGTLKLTFDEIDGLNPNVASAVIELRYYFHKTSWESKDGLALYFETANGMGSPLLSIFGDDAEKIKGKWKSASITIPKKQLAKGRVVITMSNSSGKEMIMIDRISVKGIKN